MSTLAGELLERYAADRTRLLDMLWDVQHARGWLPEEDLRALAAGLGTTYLDVRETASFYHLFHERPAGRIRLHLADTVLARMHGYAEVLAALESETGARLGEVDPSGTFGLFSTPCIGLSDQEPAMLVEDVVLTELTPQRVTEIVAALRAGRTPQEVANPRGLPTDTLEYVDALVASHVQTEGPVFFRPHTDVGDLIRSCLRMTPTEIVELVTASDLRGRGGAGFATGLKWRLCAAAEGRHKHVICNADEGEPGTFKDRVLLTRSPDLVLAGMVLAAYAIGADDGIIYLRGEYPYLVDYLDRQLRDLREAGLLGTAIAGREGFDFDIRIQRGAGAYVCGEESALIESCEGKRGTPRLKPPFPAQVGYLGEPTCIDNVESFAAVTRLLEKGPVWFNGLGTIDSAGTRLLSVAGDCDHPGIYEVEWGTTLGQVLEQVGARDPWAVQVGGPSGECVSALRDATRRIAFEDLPCNGAFTIFDSSRDLLGIVRHHLQFFVDESCGICVPCRAGNTALLQGVDRLLAGRADATDLERLRGWSELVRRASRCGLGGTSPKPLLTTIDRFPEVYRARLAATDSALRASFDAGAEVEGYAALAAGLEEERAR
ncbi:MAG TPA: NAD(P)H-dependent oxidoreductase subunit E [Nocardioides sp.]|uniref:NAD(P)H-dependent oxidoreductase subunit E n=1 Tax=Nocardioides sp. TaxID=35761 RepID=UPI002C16BEB6|nr:NAD(P)H-dependent oxidoreductase subunit E [Nocardioides sp.]HQR27434.1 NAD(P)H-dependent oxidoreductase subunit E [Nocardioides sp.]